MPSALDRSLEKVAWELASERVIRAADPLHARAERTRYANWRSSEEAETTRSGFAVAPPCRCLGLRVCGRPREAHVARAAALLKRILGIVHMARVILGEMSAPRRPWT